MSVVSAIAVGATEKSDGTGRFGDLLPALAWLDGRLEQAVAAAQVAFGPEAARDSFRGLYLQKSDIEQRLSRPAGESPFFLPKETDGVTWPKGDCESSALIRLGAIFALTAFDLRLFVIALAPELDLRYEQIYAYLQDDVSRKRPTVELALRLLCDSPDVRLRRLSHLVPDAPLIRNGLLSLIPDPQQVQPPKLASAIKVDDQVVQWLLELEGIDPRLSPYCSLSQSTGNLDELPMPRETRIALKELTRQANQAELSLVLYFNGPRGAGQSCAAAAVAGAVDRSLLRVDLELALSRASDFENALPTLFRTARLQESILCFESVELLASGQHPGTSSRLLDALRQQQGIVVLCGTSPWATLSLGLKGVHTVAFGVPAFPERVVAWRSSLSAFGLDLKDDDVNSLAGRYRLTSEQISNAAEVACDRAAWQSATQSSAVPCRPDFRDLSAAARSQATVVLSGLVRKIEPRAEWADLVLPFDPLAQLRELCDHAKYRHVVYGEWGFDQKLSRGKGLVALFAGPPGTGKTMAAEVIANELGLELFKIELSQVVNKYIGETEKNLDRVFNTAEQANAILLFDEADAVFGQRSQVHDAHDRYANIETGYLLQKMEEYDGVAILATNLAANMDDAFVRRLTFRVEFPFPDETQRRHIWRQSFPDTAPLDPELDFDYLARRFKISGGNIKNIVLSASFLAAAQQRTITMQNLLQAVRREYQKMGKTMTAADLGEHFSPIPTTAK